MNKIFLIFSTMIIFCSRLNGQELISGDYFRYDTLKVYSKQDKDSIRFNLEYVEIGRDSLWFAIIPMYSNQLHYFGFLDNGHKFSFTRIIKDKNGYLSNLLLTDDFTGNISKSKVTEKKTIQLKSLNDSILIIDGKKFKRDKGLKVFQSFTGY